jgi:hypothetical protein
MGQRCSVASYNEQQKQQPATNAVIAGLVPAIQTRMPGTGPGMTNGKLRFTSTPRSIRGSPAKAMQQGHAKRREESFAPFARP